MWRERLEDYLGGSRLERLERKLGRDPADYFLDPRNIADIPESDIAWLFRTLDLRVLTELPKGDFLSPRKGVSDRLYNHGERKTKPTPVGVDVETVISLGAFGRLILEFGWPPDCLGLQTGKWGFDLSGYLQGSERLLLQCEIKTKAREIDKMCDYMDRTLSGHDVSGVASSKQRKNWDPKLEQLIANPPVLLWTLGPGGYGRVYRIDVRPEGSGFQLLPGTVDDLRYVR